MVVPTGGNDLYGQKKKIECGSYSNLGYGDEESVHDAGLDYAVNHHTENKKNTGNNTGSFRRMQRRMSAPSVSMSYESFDTSWSHMVVLDGKGEEDEELVSEGEESKEEEGGMVEHTSLRNEEGEIVARMRGLEEVEHARGLKYNSSKCVVKDTTCLHRKKVHHSSINKGSDKGIPLQCGKGPYVQKQRLEYGSYSDMSWGYGLQVSSNKAELSYDLKNKNENYQKTGDVRMFKRRPRRMSAPSVSVFYETLNTSWSHIGAPKEKENGELVSEGERREEGEAGMTGQKYLSNEEEDALESFKDDRCAPGVNKDDTEFTAEHKTTFEELGYEVMNDPEEGVKIYSQPPKRRVQRRASSAPFYSSGGGIREDKESFRNQKRLSKKKGRSMSNDDISAELSFSASDDKPSHQMGRIFNAVTSAAGGFTRKGVARKDKEIAVKDDRCAPGVNKDDTGFTAEHKTTFEELGYEVMNDPEEGVKIYSQRPDQKPGNGKRRAQRRASSAPFYSSGSGIREDKESFRNQKCLSKKKGRSMSNDDTSAESSFFASDDKPSHQMGRIFSVLTSAVGGFTRRGYKRKDKKIAVQESSRAGGCSNNIDKKCELAESHPPPAVLRSRRKSSQLASLASMPTNKAGTFSSLKSSSSNSQNSNQCLLKERDRRLAKDKVTVKIKPHGIVTSNMQSEVGDSSDAAVCKRSKSLERADSWGNMDYDHILDDFLEEKPPQPKGSDNSNNDGGEQLRKSRRRASMF